MPTWVKQTAVAIIASVAGTAFTWAWMTSSQMTKLQAQVDELQTRQSTMSKFWLIHAQTKDELNRINFILNRPLWSWDLTVPPYRPSEVQ